MQFWWIVKGQSTEIVVSPTVRVFHARASFPTFLSPRRFLAVSVILRLIENMASQDFVSLIMFIDQQMADAIQLQPSLERLLRDAKVDNATILALLHCQINDRDTFVRLDDSADGLKSLAKDVDIDLENGGMPHKREFARISKRQRHSWK